MSEGRVRVLFTGYGAVHFVCFRPLFERLRRSARFDVRLSGGIRRAAPDAEGAERAAGTSYDHEALYGPLGVDPAHVLPVEEIRGREFDVVFAANTKLVRPRAAGMTVQIFHGLSFRNAAVREQNMGCDRYFLAGPYMKRRFVESGLMARDDPRGLPIGFMKTDRLLDGSLDREEILAREGLDGRRPVVLYAPTGARGNSLETMGEELIGGLRATGRYDLLIKLHDHPKDAATDWRTRLAPLEDGHTRVAREADVVPLMFASDLLVSDASSVSSEYSLLDRPMVFADVPELLEKQRAKAGSRMDLETWGRRGGAIARTPAEAVEAAADALAQPGRLSDIRRAMARDLFYNPGHATDAAMEWLERTFAR
jgi:hypothetical protein